MSKNGKPKPERAKVLENVQYALPDDLTGIELFPTLFDLLTPRWKDGVMVREEGRLTIVADGSMWKATITCPTEKVQCSVLCNQLGQLLGTCEEVISSGKVNWSQTWNARRKHLQHLDDPV